MGTSAASDPLNFFIIVIYNLYDLNHAVYVLVLVPLQTIKTRLSAKCLK